MLPCQIVPVRMSGTHSQSVSQISVTVSSQLPRDVPFTGSVVAAGPKLSAQAYFYVFKARQPKPKCVCVKSKL